MVDNSYTLAKTPNYFYIFPRMPDRSEAFNEKQNAWLLKIQQNLFLLSTLRKNNVKAMLIAPACPLDSDETNAEP